MLGGRLSVMDKAHRQVVLCGAL